MSEKRNEGKPAEILEVSEEELLAQIGREAEERLGMSLEEFAEKYRGGERGPRSPAARASGRRRASSSLGRSQPPAAPTARTPAGAAARRPGPRSTPGE
jgi:hypothetical protein